MILKGDIGKIEMIILKRSNTETNDYWDGNWLNAEVRIEVTGTKAVYRTNFRVEDLQRFYESLSVLNKRYFKEAEFTTMEEGLFLRLDVEPNGIVNCRGRANIEGGNGLDFSIKSDLATLAVFVDALKETLVSYPLIGNLE